MWCHEQEPIKVSHQPAKFGDHRHSDSGIIMVFVSHVIKTTGHVTLQAGSHQGKLPSWQV